VVTATKSLFNAHAHDESLAETFSLISHALKLMNMRGMFMALSLVRVENQSLRLTCAGMPPLFIYRAATGQVEEHLQKAVPLGSIKQYPYTEFTLEFHSGDLLLLMSDGLPERFNADKEMLGDDTIKRMLADHGHTISPQALIEKLLALGEDWAAGIPQDDDITLLVLKAR
ncbi:MAG: serine/threonine-protein phosphatase, partial [Acidobacteria bacterium]|nr:serine/threonine-protein phosphatase [Acidobacteriota bacterium]